jgi:hypothetical protein
VEEDDDDMTLLEIRAYVPSTADLRADILSNSFDQPNNGFSLLQHLSTSFEFPMGVNNYATLYPNNFCGRAHDNPLDGQQLSGNLLLLKWKNHPVLSYLRSAQGQLQYKKLNKAPETMLSFYNEHEAGACVPRAIGDTIKLPGHEVRFNFGGNGLHRAVVGQVAELVVVANYSLAGADFSSVAIRAVGPSIVRANISLCDSQEQERTTEIRGSYILPLAGTYLLEIYVPWVSVYPTSQLVYQGILVVTEAEAGAAQNQNQKRACGRGDHGGYWIRTDTCALPYCQSTSDDWKRLIFDEVKYNFRYLWTGWVSMSDHYEISCFSLLP